MKLAVPKNADPGLNMTPMIDIVFQLILFFLFNLRFKSLDWRIETSLPNRFGLQPIPKFDDLPHLRATLLRLDPEDPDRARTKVKLGGHEWVLPSQRAEDLREREGVLAQVTRAIERLRPGPKVPGEIDVPAPRGTAVPHGDVVSVLDAFLAAGVEEVHLQGAAWPSPRR